METRIYLSDVIDESDVVQKINRCIRLRTAFVEEGSQVLLSSPFARILAVRHWQERCFVCFQQLDCVSRCGACHIAHYCEFRKRASRRTLWYCAIIGSKACQKSDWKLDHRIECAIFRQLATLRLQDHQISDILLLGRVVRRIDGLALDIKTSTVSDKLNDLSISPMDLMWHSVDITNETNLLSLLTQKLGLVRGI